MIFNITAAYLVATVTVAFLSVMAIRNHRSGWRRERSNVVLDTLMIWAEANQEMRKAPEKIGILTAVPISVGNQLAALHAALNVNAGLAPPPIQIGAEQQQTTPVAVQKG